MSAGGYAALLAAVARPGRAGDVPAEAAVQPVIERLRQRDPAAWDELVAAEMDAIYRYVLSRCGDRDAAEDLTAAVFEAAWKAAGSLRDEGLPPRAWLFGIARNVTNSHRRRWFRRPPALSLETYDGSGDDPGLDPSLLDLARAVASLPRGQAEVVTLRFVHGLSVEEVAAVLNTSPASIRGRQYRALAELRRLMGAGPR